MQGSPAMPVLDFLLGLPGLRQRPFAGHRDEGIEQRIDGVDALYFQCYGVVKDPERLKNLFDLFSLTLTRLVQIDSAYEDDPGVSL